VFTFCWQSDYDVRKFAASPVDVAYDSRMACPTLPFFRECTYRYLKRTGVSVRADIQKFDDSFLEVCHAFFSTPGEV
jgi:hypothetical protein